MINDQLNGHFSCVSNGTGHSEFFGGRKEILPVWFWILDIISYDNFPDLQFKKLETDTKVENFNLKICLCAINVNLKDVPQLESHPM